MSSSSRASWTVRLSSASKAELRLFCFPYAGGGASAFRGWDERLPHNVEVIAIQAPGRESRLREAPVRHLPTLVDAIVDETRALRDAPFAFFGHSVGGLVAFEVARELRRRGARAPRHLFVSACPAPHLGDASPSIAELPDDELLEHVRRLDGTPDEVLAHRGLMELMLPTLRADIGLRDHSTYAAEAPLDLPLTALVGHDDAAVVVEDAAAWRDQTSSSFRLLGFPGGHFFLREARDSVLRAIATDLEPHLAASVARFEGAKIHA